MKTTYLLKYLSWWAGAAPYLTVPKVVVTAGAKLLLLGVAGAEGGDRGAGPGLASRLIRGEVRLWHRLCRRNDRRIRYRIRHVARPIVL